MEVQTPSFSVFQRAFAQPAERELRESAATLPERLQVIETWTEADQSGSARPMLPRTRSERVSRGVNILLATIGVVLSAPLFLLVALAVKCTSPGPIFYRQTRVGLDRRRRRGGDMLYDRRAKDLGGTVFTIYKFRSMRADAEKGSGAVWAVKGDPRVTPVGKMIRKMRLDELPQLINVIKGDMNIVGPRPERPGIFQHLSESIEEYPMRQLAKPGITGLAQVNRAYDACLDDVRQKVRYDLEYIRRQGVLEDLKIMLKTVPVVILGEKGW
jgi:lipopolysaccharide/colanic/teichoic acid biosynthesis glycosyltransferase